MVTISLDKELREWFWPEDSRGSAGCCWHLVGGMDKSPLPKPPREPEESGLTRALLARRGGLPGCLINSGTNEEKPAWSCLKVIKFLCCLSALISAALCEMTLGLALGLSLL